MRNLMKYAFVLFAFAVLAYPLVAKQKHKQKQKTSQIDNLVDRIVAREKDEVETIRRFHPMVETYIQDTLPNKELGSVPVRDAYYLGVADFSSAVAEHSLLDPTGRLARLSKIVSSLNLGAESYSPTGFLWMVFIGTKAFDRDPFHFEYVRREFLGEVRCIVFDVTPLPTTNGGFQGRFWATEQDLTIVRFNGVFTPVSTFDGFNVHFDSWRGNLRPGLWLPTHVYSEETALKDFLWGTRRFKSQIRLWGYDLTANAQQSEFSQMTIEAPGGIQDQAEASQDASPIAAERLWRRAAEDNVVERLQRSGLLAQPGTVDKILSTVVNNLEVTNNLDIQPEVRCRVLLTSTLESFSIGHTIVVSKGLLDVLPDEASLAAILAQELASVLLTEPKMDIWGFNDLTNIPAVDVIQRLKFRLPDHDLQLANEKAFELLEKSPYKDKLVNAGLFLKQLEAERRVLPSLVEPRLGNPVVFADKLMASAPTLEPTNIDQTAALPLGGRIKVDPWNDEIVMNQSAQIRPTSPREKMPFEVTPL